MLRFIFIATGSLVVLIYASYRYSWAPWVPFDIARERLPFPTDSELARRLAQHRDSFNRLITMVREDSEVVQIAPDFTRARDSIGGTTIRDGAAVGFTVARWIAYRQLFQRLGVEGGIFWRPQDQPRVIYLIVQTKGTVSSGTTKGYAYSDTKLSPSCESLDAYSRDTSTGICFKPILEGWYLYFDID
jgi:hypothetical protein